MTPSAVPDADNTRRGLLSAIDQLVGGIKTFMAKVVAAAGLEVQTSALHVTGAPSGLTAGAHAWLGSYNGSSAAALWLGNAGASPTASNYTTLAFSGGGAFWNAPANNGHTWSHNAVTIATLSSTGVFTTGGDVETTGASSGFILKSPNGSRWRLTVSNAGVVSATAL